MASTETRGDSVRLVWRRPGEDGKQTVTFPCAGGLIDLAKYIVEDEAKHNITADELRTKMIGSPIDPFEFERRQRTVSMQLKRLIREAVAAVVDIRRISESTRDGHWTAVTTSVDLARAVARRDGLVDAWVSLTGGPWTGPLGDEPEGTFDGRYRKEHELQNRITAARERINGLAAAHDQAQSDMVKRLYRRDIENFQAAVARWTAELASGAEHKLEQQPEGQVAGERH